MAASAEQLYAAFMSICPVDENGMVLPPIEKLSDGGRGWFAISNAAEKISAPAPAPADPYDVDLVPIPERIDPDDGLVIQETPEERPSKIKIRAFTAADLCVREMDDRMMHAVLARATGIDLHTIEWRMDPSDVTGAIALCIEAHGDDASVLARAAYFDGGGTQALEGCPIEAWFEVARLLRTEITCDVARVRCRTPGIGTLTLGPLRAGHMRLYTGTAARETEWTGRLAAIAKAADRPLGSIMTLRIEDAVAVWEAFETLKKKAEGRANTPIGSRLSATFSRASAKPTSTT